MANFRGKNLVFNPWERGRGEKIFGATVVAIAFGYETKNLKKNFV